MKIPGMTPLRVVVANGDGTYTLTVTPPSITGFSPSVLKLSENEFRQYEKWDSDPSLLIQDAFPGWTGAVREQVLTGINPDEWDKTFPEE